MQNNPFFFNYQTNTSTMILEHVQVVLSLADQVIDLLRAPGPAVWRPKFQLYRSR